MGIIRGGLVRSNAKGIRRPLLSGVNRWHFERKKTMALDFSILNRNLPSARAIVLFYDFHILLCYLCDYCHMALRILLCNVPNEQRPDNRKSRIQIGRPLNVPFIFHTVNCMKMGNVLCHSDLIKEKAILDEIVTSCEFYTLIFYSCVDTVPVH